MKKILIDANPIVPYFVSGRINGIGRTNIELINALDQMDNTLPFKIELLTQNIKGITAARLNTGFKVHHIFLRNNVKHNEWSRRLRLREFLSRYDLQHITHNYEVVTDPARCIITIHDAMFFSYPESFLGAERNRELIPRFAQRAKHIITISENSKREIIKYMNIPEEKITVIPWGINHKLLFPREISSNRWCGTKPYFTSVSCDIGRKNTITLIKAYKEFAKRNPEHHLILVWNNPSDEALKLVEDPDLKNRIHFDSNLKNEELALLYAGATATFFPSLYEGFGLPVLESMACGTPCVTCRNSSLEEVGGAAAIYVEPFDIDGMVNIMENFENRKYDMQNLKAVSLSQAAKFTWEKCAESTVEVYKKCLEI